MPSPFTTARRIPLNTTSSGLGPIARKMREDYANPPKDKAGRTSDPEAEQGPTKSEILTPKRMTHFRAPDNTLKPIKSPSGAPYVVKSAGWTHPRDPETDEPVIINEKGEAKSIYDTAPVTKSGGSLWATPAGYPKKRIGPDPDFNPNVATEAEQKAQLAKQKADEKEAKAIVDENLDRVKFEVNQIDTANELTTIATKREEAKAKLVENDTAKELTIANAKVKDLEDKAKSGLVDPLTLSAARAELEAKKSTAQAAASNTRTITARALDEDFKRATEKQIMAQNVEQVKLLSTGRRVAAAMPAPAPPAQDSTKAASTPSKTVSLAPVSPSVEKAHAVINAPDIQNAAPPPAPGHAFDMPELPVMDYKIRGKADVSLPGTDIRSALQGTTTKFIPDAESPDGMGWVEPPDLNKPARQSKAQKQADKDTPVEWTTPEAVAAQQAAHDTGADSIHADDKISIKMPAPGYDKKGGLNVDGREVGEIRYTKNGTPEIVLAPTARGQTASPSYRSDNPFGGAPEWAAPSADHIEAIRAEAEANDQDPEPRIAQTWEERRMQPAEFSELIDNWNGAGDFERRKLMDTATLKSMESEMPNARELYRQGVISLQQARQLDQAVYGRRPVLPPPADSFAAWKDGDSEAAKKLRDATAGGVLKSTDRQDVALQSALINEWAEEYLKRHGDQPDFDAAAFHAEREKIASKLGTPLQRLVAGIESTGENVAGSIAGLIEMADNASPQVFARMAKLKAAPDLPKDKIAAVQAKKASGATLTTEEKRIDFLTQWAGGKDVDPTLITSTPTAQKSEQMWNTMVQGWKNGTRAWMKEDDNPMNRPVIPHELRGTEGVDYSTAYATEKERADAHKDYLAKREAGQTSISGDIDWLREQIDNETLTASSLKARADIIKAKATKNLGIASDEVASIAKLTKLNPQLTPAEIKAHYDETKASASTPYDVTAKSAAASLLVAYSETRDPSYLELLKDTLHETTEGQKVAAGAAAWASKNGMIQDSDFLSVFNMSRRGIQLDVNEALIEMAGDVTLLGAAKAFTSTSRLLKASGKAGQAVTRISRAASKADKLLDLVKRTKDDLVDAAKTIGTKPGATVRNMAVGALKTNLVATGTESVEEAMSAQLQEAKNLRKTLDQTLQGAAGGLFMGVLGTTAGAGLNALDTLAQNAQRTQAAEHFVKQWNRQNATQPITVDDAKSIRGLINPSDISQIVAERRAVVDEISATGGQPSPEQQQRLIATELAEDAIIKRAKEAHDELGGVGDEKLKAFIKASMRVLTGQQLTSQDQLAMQAVNAAGAPLVEQTGAGVTWTDAGLAEVAQAAPGIRLRYFPESQEQQELDAATKAAQDTSSEATATDAAPGSSQEPGSKVDPNNPTSPAKGQSGETRSNSPSTKAGGPGSSPGSGTTVDEIDKELDRKSAEWQAGKKKVDDAFHATQPHSQERKDAREKRRQWEEKNGETPPPSSSNPLSDVGALSNKDSDIKFSLAGTGWRLTGAKETSIRGKTILYVTNGKDGGWVEEGDLTEQHRQILARPSTSTVDEAAHAAATSPTNNKSEPTQAQKEAGNYPVGKINVSGLRISIENPAGSKRSGKSKNGKAWTTTMQAHYGYMRGTVGADGDQIDVFVKQGTTEDFGGDAYVIPQYVNGKFDEHKVMIGYSSVEEAKKAYKAHYEKGWEGYRPAMRVPMSELAAMVKSGKLKKPTQRTRTNENDNTRNSPTRTTTQASGNVAGSRDTNLPAQAGQMAKESDSGSDVGPTPASQGRGDAGAAPGGEAANIQPTSPANTGGLREVSGEGGATDVSGGNEAAPGADSSSVQEAGQEQRLSPDATWTIRTTTGRKLSIKADEAKDEAEALAKLAQQTTRGELLVRRLLTQPAADLGVVQQIYDIVTTFASGQQTADSKFTMSLGAMIAVAVKKHMPTLEASFDKIRVVQGMINGGGMAVEPSTNTLIISPKTLIRSLQALPAKDMAEFVDRGLFHEYLHAVINQVVDEADAAKFWNGLTPQAQDEFKAAYSQGGTTHLGSDSSWGHEFLRAYLENRFGKGISEEMFLSTSAFRHAVDLIKRIIARLTNIQTAISEGADKEWMLNKVSEVSAAYIESRQNIETGNVDAARNAKASRAKAKPIGSSQMAKAYVNDQFGAMLKEAGIELVPNFSSISAHYVVSEGGKRRGGYIEYNPMRLAEWSPGQITDAMREEIIHALEDKALLAETLKRGYKLADSYIQSGQYHIDFFAGVHDMMTPEQIKYVKSIYTSHGNKKYVIGSEFRRMVMQREHYGGITEQAMAGNKTPAKANAALEAVASLFSAALSILKKMMFTNSAAGKQARKIYDAAKAELERIDPRGEAKPLMMAAPKSQAYTEAVATAQRLEREGIDIRARKRQAKFMSEEWKALNRQAANNARETDAAWKREATLRAQQPMAAPASRESVTSGKDLTGDGRSFAKFFASVTQGAEDKFKPTGNYTPAIELDPSSKAFQVVRYKFRGNFDDHIATSIPGFDEVQAVVGSAIVKTFGDEGADMLDIGASEGALNKAITGLSKGKIKTLAIDPNTSMAQTFKSKGSVKGADFDLSAFGSKEDADKTAWTEDDGTDIKFFNPKGRKFDVVHEAMVFQFISNARNAQVMRVKELMKPEGIAIFEQKFGDRKDVFDANENKKDLDWKSRHYSMEQLEQKRQAVLNSGGDQVEGMTALQVAHWEMEEVLRSNFKNVVQFWSSGNFRGYVASDSAATISKFVANTQSTQSEFATQDTPRVVAGELTPMIMPYAESAVRDLGKLTHAEEGGDTLNLDGSKYTGGGVAIPVLSKNVDDYKAMRTSDIGQFINPENIEYVAAGGIVLKAGIYKFPNSNKASIDLNIIAPREMREEGLKIAGELGQESAFDLDANENIKTGQDGMNPRKPTVDEVRDIAARLQPMAAPSPAILKTRQFHSTPSEEAGLSIIKGGTINPPNNTHARAKLAPVVGKTYISNRLDTAAIYSLGGVMMGTDYDWKSRQDKAAGQYGYIFEIDPTSITDVQPDEDNVGEMAFKAMDGDASLPQWMKRMGDRLVTDREKRNKLEYANWAALGKRMLKEMTDAQKIELIETHGAQIANTGSLKFIRAWKLDKSKSKLLAKDGSNLFEVAEKVFERAAPADELNLGRKADPDMMRQKNVKRIVEKTAAAHPEALKVEYVKDGDAYRLDEKGLPVAHPMEYNLPESRLAKTAAHNLRGVARLKAYQEALASKLIEFYATIKDQPEVMAGREWYRVAREKLVSHFGPDTMLFSQLLAATSARTPVQQNFEQALDAYNGILEGRFDGMTERYLDAMKSMESGGLQFRKSTAANKMGDIVTPKTFRDWLDIEGIMPRRSNGKKYNANSLQVLNVIAGVWREKLGGPKTAQFSDNLSGASMEATIDVWAARTLHRLSNEQEGARWRILPEAETGVNNEDFAIGQVAFRIAAQELGMNPDDLQGVLWFAEKRHWANRGWTRAAGSELSDFSSLLDFVTTEGGKKILRIDNGQGTLDLFHEDTNTANQPETRRLRSSNNAAAQPIAGGAGNADIRSTDRPAASRAVAGRVSGGRGNERAVADEQSSLFMAAPKIEGLTKTVIQGKDAETGKPITFNFLHNRSSYTKERGRPYKPSKDEAFDRGYEPSGQYMVATEDDYLIKSYPADYIAGTTTFNNPIVIKSGEYGEESSWKRALSKAYGSKSGKALSKAIIASGHDGIITVPFAGNHGEIVDLTTFDESKALFMAAPQPPNFVEPGFYSELRATIEAKMPGSIKAEPARTVPGRASPERTIMKDGKVLKVIKAAQEPDKSYPARTTAEQIKSMLEAADVTQEEIKWSGIMPWLEGRDSVTKQEMIDYLDTEGKTRFQETWLNNEPTPEAVTELARARKAFEANRQEMLTKYGDFRNFHRAGTSDEQRNDNNLEAKMQMAEMAADRSSMEPKYAQHTTPGGKNYREIVLTRPTRETVYRVYQDGEILIALNDENAANEFAARRADWDNDPVEIKRETIDSWSGDYTSSHYREIPNYVAHMRLDDRTDAAGKQGTLIEEAQSDRHQAGRKSGYKSTNPEALFSSIQDKYLGIAESSTISGPDKTGIWKATINEGKQDHFAAFGKTGDEAKQNLLRHLVMKDPAYAEVIDKPISGSDSRVPDAPYRQSTAWSLALFKRALRDAVENGMEWIGWTTGATQNERYGLEKHLSKVTLQKPFGPQDKRIAIQGFDHDFRRVIDKLAEESELSDYVGEELAAKFNAMPWKPYNVEQSDGRMVVHDSKVLQGLDLKVGGKGMTGFYDDMMPKEIGRYVKQWGAKVEKGAIPGNHDASGNSNKEWDESAARRIVSNGGEIYVTGKTHHETLIDSLESLADYINENGTPSGYILGDVQPSTAIWQIQITPQMRESIQTQGQPLFMAGPRHESPQAANEMLERMMAELPSAEELEVLRAMAHKESNGNRSIGVPEKANISKNEKVRVEYEVIKQIQSGDIAPEKVQEWLDEGRKMARNEDDVANQVMSNYFNGAGFDSPELVFASALVTARKFKRAQQSNDPAAMREAQALAYADGAGRTQTGRSLRAMADPHKSPHERASEFICKMIVTPSIKERNHIASAPSPFAKEKEIARLKAKLEELKQKIIDNEKAGVGHQTQEPLVKQHKAASAELAAKVKEKDRKTLIEEYTEARHKAIVEALAREGVTEEDIFVSPEERLNAQDSEPVREAMQQHPQEHQDAIRYIMRGYSHADISVMTGLTKDIVAGIHQDFRQKSLRGTLAKWVKKGNTLFDTIQNGIKYVFGQSMAAPAGFQGNKQQIIAAEAEIERQLAVLCPTAKQVNGGKFSVEVVNRKSGQEVTVKVPFSPTDFRQTYRVARAISTAQSSAFDKIYEWWIMGLLSGPETNIVNVLGNAASSGVHLLAQRPLETLWNIVFRDPESAQMGEWSHIMRGIMPGIRDAFTMAALAFDAEADPIGHRYLDETMDLNFDKAGQLAKVGTYRGPSIASKKGRIIRIPGRALMAMDSFMKALMGNIEVGAQAYRLAKLAQARGEISSAPADLEAFIKTEVATPGSNSWRLAMDTATELAFQDENWFSALAKHFTQRGLDARGFQKKAIDAAARGDSKTMHNMRRAANVLTFVEHAMRFIFPFVRTPTNILRMGVRKSPLGSVSLAAHIMLALGRGAYNWTGSKPFWTNQDRATLVKLFAEQTQAWFAVATLWSMIEGDDDDDDKKIILVGGRPSGTTSPGDRNEAYRNYGGTYLIIYRYPDGKEERFAFGRYEPIATALGTTIDAIREVKNMARLKRLGMEGGDATLALGNIIGSLMSQTEDKSFFQGYANLIKTVEAIRRGGDAPSDLGKGLMRQILQGIVPNIIRQPIRNADLLTRDTKDKGDLLYSALPLGDWAGPVLDYYGREAQKGGSSLSRMFVRSANEPLAKQPVEKWITRWNNNRPDDKFQPTDMKVNDYWVYGPNGERRMIVDNKVKTDFEREVGAEILKRHNNFVATLQQSPNGKIVSSDSEDVDLKSRLTTIATEARKAVRQRFLKSPFDSVRNPVK